MGVAVMNGGQNPPPLASSLNRFRVPCHGQRLLSPEPCHAQRLLSPEPCHAQRLLSPEPDCTVPASMPCGMALPDMLTLRQRHRIPPLHAPGWNPQRGDYIRILLDNPADSSYSRYLTGGLHSLRNNSVARVRGFRAQGASTRVPGLKSRRAGACLARNRDGVLSGPSTEPQTLEAGSSDPSCCAVGESGEGGGHARMRCRGIRQAHVPASHPVR
jgi:hypothetical protein